MNLKEQRLAIEEIFTSRGFEPREHSIKNIVGRYVNPVLPHVTAVGTSGGKTFTTAARLEFNYKYGYTKQNEHSLILAADKSILRSNFIQQFNSFFETIPASFSYKAVTNKKELELAIEEGVQVIITLPQTVQNPKNLEILSQLNFKWFIEDESHKWYFKPTIQRIIRTLNPTYQSLLTGTPFKFNRQNKIEHKFLIEYTSVREMYELGFLSDFTAQVLHSDIELTKLDYSGMLSNLKADKKLNEDELIAAFDSVISQIIKKLKLPFKDLATAHNLTKNITSVFGKLQKSIIFTHGIAEANCLYEYLKRRGINVLITHSQTGLSSDDVFDSFKDDDDVKVLIAVNQGKEGFDFPELYNVIDMTYSQNFEVVMQIIGRVLRKSSKIPSKYFFKVAPRNTASYFVDWMNALFMLFDEEWYSRFDGKNGFDIEIPNSLIGRGRSDDEPGTSSNSPRRNNNRTGEIKPRNLDAFNSLDFMTKNKWFKLNDSLSTAAVSTLREVCDIHAAQKTLEEIKEDMVGSKPAKEETPIHRPFVDPDEYIKSLKEKKVSKQDNKKTLEDIKKAILSK